MAEITQGTLKIKSWNIKKLNEKNSQLVVTLDKENIKKVIDGLLPLLEKNETFFLGYTLSDFNLHYEHNDAGLKEAEEKEKKLILDNH